MFVRRKLCKVILKRLPYAPNNITPEFINEVNDDVVVYICIYFFINEKFLNFSYIIASKMLWTSKISL